MMKVKNQKTIRTLTLSRMKAGKSRNLFAVIAIILTTVLITAVFTIGIGLMDGIRQMIIRNSGRSAEVTFNYATEEEAALIAAHPLIEEIGFSKLVASTSEGIFYQAPCEIRSMDKAFADFCFVELSEGHMPQSNDEVAVMAWILDEMNLPRETGQSIHLDFDVDGNPQSLDLKVSGFWDTDINLHPYGWAVISDDLANELLKGVNPAETRLGRSYSGITQVYANLQGKKADLQAYLSAVITDTGIDGVAISAYVNGAYETNNNSNIGIISAMVLIVFIILISGYLLIYNIFYISVIGDIKFYGLLKAIGTTKKQIGRIVNMQALLLCMIGIPVGLAFGFVLGVFLIPSVLSLTSLEIMRTSTNPWIFVLGAAVSFATVLISCRNPAKTAGKVSPVEAVHYTGVGVNTKRKMKKGTTGANIPRMAFSNMLRNKKRTAVVIASVSIGLILFNIVYTFVNSYDVEKYLQHYLNGDFLIADAGYFNMAKINGPSFSLKQDVLDDIGKLDGVEETAKIYFEQGFEKAEGYIHEKLLDYYRNDPLMKRSFQTEAALEAHLSSMNSGYSFSVQVFGYDDYWLNILEESVINGEFDRDKFLSGEYVLLGHDNQNFFEPGDEVSFKLRTEDGEERSYTVLAEVSMPFSLGAHYQTAPGYTLYLPASELEQITDANIMSATVIAGDGYLDKLQTEIGDAISSNQYLDFRSRADYLDEMKNDTGRFALIGFTLCIIVLFIGVLNVINTTMTNIISRKQELAMLQAIGMTNAQSKLMLALECLYGVATAFIIFITFGNALSYIIIGNLSRESPAFTYSFTAIPALVCFPALLVISLLLPLSVYRSISRTGIVERLAEVN